MKALTIWQPWASLVMIGAKPLEFRSWSYLDRAGLRDLLNQRIVIHAGARPVRPAEVMELLAQVAKGHSSLIPEKALPLLERLAAASKCQGVIELSAALGTAVLGKPRRVDALFKKPDSDRVEHHMYGWPLTDIRRFREPVSMRGFQGFWIYPEKAAA